VRRGMDKPEAVHSVANTHIVRRPGGAAQAHPLTSEVIHFLWPEHCPMGLSDLGLHRKTSPSMSPLATYLQMWWQWCSREGTQGCSGAAGGQGCGVHWGAEG